MGILYIGSTQGELCCLEVKGGSAILELNNPELFEEN